MEVELNGYKTFCSVFNTFVEYKCLIYENKKLKGYYKKFTRNNQFPITFDVWKS
jgi:hypothetical protein